MLDPAEQRTVSHADTPRHGHGTACHGRRPRRPSGQGTHPGTVARVLRSGCYTTGSLTLSSAQWRSRRQQAGVSELFAGRLGGRLAATNASRPCDEAFAGGDWLTHRRPIRVCYQSRARRKLALGAANGVSAGRRSRPEEFFGRRKSGGRRLSRGEPSCGYGVSGLPH